MNRTRKRSYAFIKLKTVPDAVFRAEIDYEI